jgi:hypothetical protein
MANYSNLYTKNESLDITKFKKDLNDIDQRIFKGNLNINFHESENISFISEIDGICWYYENKPFIINDKKVSNNFYAFKDCPSPEYFRYIQEIIEKELVKNGYTIFIDCIGEEVTDTNYPKNFKEFIARSWMISGSGWLMKLIKKRGAFSSYNRWKKYAEKNLSKELFNIIFNE